jgi:hypothetical protein
MFSSVFFWSWVEAIVGLIAEIFLVALLIKSIRSR